MRSLEELLPEMTLSSTPGTPADVGGSSTGRLGSSWLAGCHGVWFDLALIAPSAIFVAYLASQARKSFAKLTYGRSHIMMAYYAVLWLVCALNLLWCVLQGWQCSSTREFSWNMLSLFSKSGMLFLEVSLLAFLLQGNHTGGLETLTQTFIISGVVVAADALLKAIYIFGFAVPLYVDNSESSSHVKWGLLLVHKLLLTAVYGLIFFTYHSRWSERLPARPAFYNYVCAMLLLNTMSLFACMLAGNEARFGFWLFNLTRVCYHSLYLPLLYVTFLADFFQEEDLRMENVYYSEMKDAGFFDADWDL